MNDTISSFVDDAVARIGDRFHGHESALRGRIEKPIHAAYQRGRHDALSELMPVADVAVTLGMDTSHVHRLARTHEIGWTIGRERLFTPDDVERLRNRPDRRRKILAPAEQDAIGNASPPRTRSPERIDTMNATLHIDFGTGLDGYADMSDIDAICNYMAERGVTPPQDEDELRGEFEDVLYEHITEVAQRVMNDAYPDIDITVEWNTFQTSSLPWEQDTIEPESEDKLAELQESLAETVERVMNHEYEQIG